MTGQPDLPDAWWRTLPVPHVLAAIGPEALAELLTEIALEHWPAAAVGDVLPALHVLDPEEADEPPVAIALDRAGSWTGLLALTGRELADQPFIRARPVLSTLFGAVFTRLAQPYAGAAGAGSAPAVPAPRSEAAPATADEALPLLAVPAPADPEPAQDDLRLPAPEAPAVPETPETPEPTGTKAEAEAGAEATRDAAAPAEDAAPEAEDAQNLAAHAEEAPRSEDAAPEAGPVQDLAARAGEAPRPEDAAPEAQDAQDVAAHAEEAPLPEPRVREFPAKEAEPGDADGEEASEDAAPAEGKQAADAAAEGKQVAGAAGPEPRAHGFAEEGEASRAEEHEASADVASGSAANERAPHAFAALEEVPAFAAPRAGEENDAPAHAFAVVPLKEEDERPVLDADVEPAADAGDGPEPTPDSVEEPAPEPAAAEAEALEADGPSSGAPTEDDEVESPEGQEDRELPELIEAAFAGLDDKSWAVAQNRVFTDEPSAVDQLAKLFAVPPSEITATEKQFRVRLGEWLDSDEAAPYRAYLDELRSTLGPEAPKERVIGAADWHKVEIRALEVPAWQFVLATLPGKQAVLTVQAPGPAAVAAPPPPVELPPPPPSPSPRLDPVLHFDAPRQPPMDMPPQSAFGPVPLPPPPPGPPQFQAFKPVTTHEQNGGSGEQKPYQPLKDVSQTRRCFRQPDGRWWLRVDVTAEQMAGGECALPTGFAAYLGLSPGESRTVRSAAGELTMTWHGRPVLESIEHLLGDVGAREGGHLFLTLSDEGVLRARHLPAAAQGAEKITKALRLVGYTAPGGTRDQAARVIATRIGLTGPVSLPDLLTRLRERGDRDLLALLD
ncbi:hypothetical protein ACBR40_40550 [Nonomuraea sp. AD125B]|uniref:hypothetical protein n=1 Tax=Nonomuraea sp. AD125B TaxID=3242897 RepID=UPI003528C539